MSDFNKITKITSKLAGISTKIGFPTRQMNFVLTCHKFSWSKYLQAQGTQRLPAPALRRSASCGNTQRPMPVLIMEYTNLTCRGRWDELVFHSDLLIFLLCEMKIGPPKLGQFITDGLWIRLHATTPIKQTTVIMPIFLDHLEKIMFFHIFTETRVVNFTNPRLPVMEH